MMSRNQPVDMECPTGLRLTKPKRQHTAILRLHGICPGQPRWAGTRRNIHPLTFIMVINRPLSASSI